MEFDENLDRTQTLLRLASAGQGSAVNELMLLHRDYLHRLVRFRMTEDLSSRFDVSDVVQETQLEASRRLGEYLSEPTVPFRVWLRQTALEQLITHRRRHVSAQRRTIHREQQLADSALMASKLMWCSPSKVLRQREFAEKLFAVMQAMPIFDREILQLRHIEELNNQEIAALLKISPDTASQRYGRALRRFVARLESSGMSSDELD